MAVTGLHCFCYDTEMRLKRHHYFFLFIFGAIVLSRVPIIHWPFSWLETYFHEISHGLAALITGGKIDHIELHFQGSGLCYTRGGWRPLVSFAGYAGAALWGALIYLGARMTGKGSRWLSLVMLVLMSLSALLWARDMETWAVMAIICTVLYLSFHYTIGKIFPFFMEFAGTYVMVSAIRSPTFMLASDNRSDGDTLASITYVPEFVWVLIWCSISVAVLALVWKKQRNL